jgi:hypothetical protein
MSATIHKWAGRAFWPAALIATGAADTPSASWGTALTLAAVAGWAGVLWLLTNPRLNDEADKENGQ